MAPSFRKLFKRRRGQASDEQGQGTSTPLPRPPIVSDGPGRDNPPRPGPNTQAYLEESLKEKLRGRLIISISGPRRPTLHVSARVSWDYWDDNRPGSVAEDQGRGFVAALHPSFELYRRQHFVERGGRPPLSPDDDDEYPYFHVEGDPRLANENPGTVTVEGFGLEAWFYELTYGRSKIRLTEIEAEENLRTNDDAIDPVPVSKMLRRLHELREEQADSEWNPAVEKAELKDLIGEDVHAAEGEDHFQRDIDRLCGLLKRTELVADFSTRANIGRASRESDKGGIGWTNFLWQMIISKELTRRLERYPNASRTGLTTRVLGSLIVADLWIKNTQVLLIDGTVNSRELPREVTMRPRRTAESLVVLGKLAEESKDDEYAIQLYTWAAFYNRLSPTIRLMRALVFYKVGNYAMAAQDAYVATLLNPTDADAWLQLGRAQLKRDLLKRAELSFLRAIELSEDGATPDMNSGLEDTRAMLKAEAEAIEAEINPTRRILLRKERDNRDWDTGQKECQLQPLVLNQQIEGLLLFAERLKWPYLDETREGIWSHHAKLESGATVPWHVWDWLYRLSLPGPWFAHKIMAALIECTPSLAQDPGTANFAECGLSLPSVSYWRIRTPLGCVLGGLPGVTSLNGWIGPCPAARFDPPLPDTARYIREDPRHVPPLKFRAVGTGNLPESHTLSRRYVAKPHITAIEDATDWVVPEPPARQAAACTFRNINLMKITTSPMMAAMLRDWNIALPHRDDKDSFYRASIAFQVPHVGGQRSFPYHWHLIAPSVFVTAPPCYNGPHAVPKETLARYMENVYLPADLAYHSPEKDEAALRKGIVINATGPGAELLARAWCSANRLNALIRRDGGPCYTCALDAVGESGMGVGVLIWVS
ncbi:tetratricopeptide repeat protein [Aspergillus undulatus]|uniref:tetratricopeptide repeat protein n=1 Tax=Aspergillus undulatus TaxID=1810928 RepID=UPI003CCDDBC5